MAQLLPARRRDRRHARADRRARDGYQPDPAIVAAAQRIAAATGGSAAVLDDPALAAKGADVLATDVWVSMGQADAPERTAALAPFQVNDELLALAAPGAIVLHCLPAHRGEEITAEVLDGPPASSGTRRRTGCTRRRRCSPGCWSSPDGDAGGARRPRRPGRRGSPRSSPASRCTRRSSWPGLLSQYAGMHVTQATLSRDLDELGVVRLRGGRRHPGLRAARRSRRARLTGYVTAPAWDRPPGSYRNGREPSSSGQAPASGQR